MILPADVASPSLSSSAEPPLTFVPKPPRRRRIGIGRKKKESNYNYGAARASLNAPHAHHFQVYSATVSSNINAVEETPPAISAPGAPLHGGFSLLPHTPMGVLVVKVYHIVQQLNSGGAGVLAPTLHQPSPPLALWFSGVGNTFGTTPSLPLSLH